MVRLLLGMPCFVQPDGVLLAGCHPGYCHYVKGNFKTLRRLMMLKKFASQAGIEDERLRLEWISVSEGVRYGEVVSDTTTKVQELGPFDLKRNRTIEARMH